MARDYAAPAARWWITAWQTDGSLRVAYSDFPDLPHDTLSWVREDTAKSLSDKRHAGPTFSNPEGLRRFLLAPYGDRPATHTPEQADEAIRTAPAIEPELQGALTTLEIASAVMGCLRDMIGQRSSHGR